MTLFSRFNTVGEHMNSVCDSMRKTFESWSQTKSQHREERWGWSLTSNQRVFSNWWLLGDRHSVLSVWPIAGQPHSSGWPHIQKYMGSQIALSGFYFYFWVLNKLKRVYILETVREGVDTMKIHYIQFLKI